MESKNKIVENIEALKSEQEKLTALKNDFNKICNQKKKDCTASYEKYFVESKACLEKTPHIITPVINNFRSVLSKAEIGRAHV